MRYEPTGYIYEYELSALFFLIVIMLRYFGTKRFPNQKNRTFSVILWITVADLILDIVSSVVIEHVFIMPSWITYLVNTAFYFLQILLPMMTTAFALILSDYFDIKRFHQFMPLAVPGFLTFGLLLSNPATHLFFYVDPVKGYVHGEVFVYTYITCVFYMVATFIIATVNRKKLHRNEYKTICSFLLIVIFAMLVQYMIPALLISGVAIALAVILMYFTIQNPDTMLDSTTGAFTSEAMLSFLNDKMQEKKHIQLVAVKIGNMTRINDLLGIENGSLLLRNICDYLHESEENAWIFRMRGSCFVAVTKDRRGFDVLSELVEKRIGEPWTIGGTEVLLHAAVCKIATEDFAKKPLSPTEVLSYIEFAVSQGERSEGRIAISSVGTELHNRIMRYKAVEEALREAIATGEGLELYFQPLWSVKKNRFTSAEVLLRFRHPTMGFIPPDEFVPIAENCGLVTAMDELVMRKACKFLHQNGHCRSLGLETVEINLSALEFMQRRLPEILGDIMAQYQIDPHYLCFEITETAATESFELLKECMDDLCACGCRFALDDFGTGFANISQVIRLPFYMVKLDRTLLFGPEAVLEDMARMFAKIDRKTVVEGVESTAQAELVKSFNVDYIQGYYYARPMNEQTFLEFLHENQKLSEDSL